MPIIKKIIQDLQVKVLVSFIFFNKLHTIYNFLCKYFLQTDKLAL